MRRKILITGASGNIGKELIHHLYQQAQLSFQILAGVRNITNLHDGLSTYKNLQYVPFDFTNSDSFDQALEGVETVFLLRPPAIADIKQFFVPLIKAFEKNAIKRVLFLSVQGADKIKMIPHYKIEQLLLKSNLEYIFLRPSYFMQNLSTTLRQDIVEENQIFLPAGKALFNWVDATNIGEAAAVLLCNFEQYKNQGFDLTGNELLNFETVVDLLNKELNKNIQYVSPNLFRFFIKKKKQGQPTAMIFVLIMLHFLPRFSQPTALSDNYTKLTGKKPNQLVDFIHRERETWLD